MLSDAFCYSEYCYAECCFFGIFLPDVVNLTVILFCYAGCHLLSVIVLSVVAPR
jgi:hypothetical protein